MLQVGMIRGDAGGRLPNPHLRRVPPQQRPDRADQHDPESDPGGTEKVENRMQVDLLQPVLDQRIG
jgi:hypothetical protein